MSTAATLFLRFIGAPTSPDMVRAVDAWLRAEGSSVIGNNPWNLHIGPPCPATAGYGVPGYKPSQSLVSSVPGLLGNRYAGTGDRNVAIFDTLAHGCQACGQNLIDHGSDFAGYDHVLAAARAGDAVGFLNALAASSWSAGHYGYPAHNRLLDYYLEAGGTIGRRDIMLKPMKFEGWTAKAGAVVTDYPGGTALATIPAGTALTTLGESPDMVFRAVWITYQGTDIVGYIRRDMMDPMVPGGDPAFDKAVRDLLLSRKAPVKESVTVSGFDLTTEG